jgi:hypothetical protein
MPPRPVTGDNLNPIGLDGLLTGDNPNPIDPHGLLLGIISTLYASTACYFDNLNPIGLDGLLQGIISTL